MAKHPVELQGSKPRDHEHPRQHYIRRAHKDWRLWVIVVLMLAMLMVYVVSNDFTHWGRRPVGPPVPAANAP